MERPLLARLRQGEDCFVSVDAPVERTLHVYVVPALDRLLALILRLHRRVAGERLVERGHALLPVQKQSLWHCARRRRALNRACLEAHFRVAGLQQHQRTDRITDREASEQAPDALVIPHPVALKLGQLEPPVADLTDQLPQLFHGVVEGRRCSPRHRRAFSHSPWPASRPPTSTLVDSFATVEHGLSRSVAQSQGRRCTRERT